MSRVFHTPGPWVAAASRSSVVGVPIIAPSGGRSIANSQQPGDEGLANARLIAAAPDLLLALRAMTELAAGPIGGVTVQMKRDAIAAARAAIQAATGES